MIISSLGEKIDEDDNDDDDDKDKEEDEVKDDDDDDDDDGEDDDDDDDDEDDEKEDEWGDRKQKKDEEQNHASYRDGGRLGRVDGSGLEVISKGMKSGRFCSGFFRRQKTGANLEFVDAAFQRNAQLIHTLQFTII